ncbi:hypothetical protein A2U01_0037415, partial [Trifolium medium]|nr:hypothetical protein [Trifolium medium]
CNSDEVEELTRMMPAWLCRLQTSA